LLSIGLTASADPVSLIFDTDMRGDCDDVGALALAHRLMDLGEVEIRGIITSTTGSHVVGAIDAINHFYGRPSIPIGLSVVPNTVSHDDFAPTLANKNIFPSVKVNSTVPNSTALYRQLLHEATNPITIAVVGYQNPLAEFLKSGTNHHGDGIPFTGMQLAEQKVAKLVMMAGHFTNPNYYEWNVRDAALPPAQYIAENWPGEIVYSGYEIGDAIRTGAALTDPENNPVAKAYQLYRHAGGVGVIGDRQSWDQAATLYAIRGEFSDGQRLWTLSNPGTAAFAGSNPYTVLSPDTNGLHRYQIQHMAPASVADIIEGFMISATTNVPPVDLDPGPGSEPVGLIAYYPLVENSGTTAFDRSGFGVPLNLTLSGGATWAVDSDGVVLNGTGAKLQSTGTASKIHARITTTGCFSVEAWIQPSIAVQGGPARIVSYSSSTTLRNFTLGHGIFNNPNSDIAFRLRTTTSNVNGEPQFNATNQLTTAAQQVVVTFDGSTLRVYRNGSLVASEARSGALTNWDAGHLLTLGAERDGTRSWAGTLLSVSIYDRAITPSVIQTRHQNGPQPPLQVVNIQREGGRETIISHAELFTSVVLEYTTQLTGDTVWIPVPDQDFERRDDGFQIQFTPLTNDPSHFYALRMEAY
jgi:hypothetical protein